MRNGTVRALKDQEAGLIAMEAWRLGDEFWRQLVMKRGDGSIGMFHRGTDAGRLQGTIFDLLGKGVRIRGTRQRRGWYPRMKHETDDDDCL